MSRFSTHSFVAAILFAVAPAFALLESPAPTHASNPTTVDDHEALEAAMGGLVDGLKALSKTIADPASNTASLATLTDMQKHALAAKQLSPPKLATLEEKDREAAQLSYRADIARLIQELCAMEIEVCEGHNDKAKERVRGKLIPLRNSSHEKHQ